MSTKADLKGKIYDPVFICMLVAILLAVGSSVLLRAMSRGPARAHAADAPVEGHPLEDVQPDE